MQRSVGRKQKLHYTPLGLNSIWLFLNIRVTPHHWLSKPPGRAFPRSLLLVEMVRLAKLSMGWRGQPLTTKRCLDPLVSFRSVLPMTWLITWDYRRIWQTPPGSLRPGRLAGWILARLMGFILPIILPLGWSLTLPWCNSVSPGSK